MKSESIAGFVNNICRRRGLPYIKLQIKSRTNGHSKIGSALLVHKLFVTEQLRAAVAEAAVSLFVAGVSGYHSLPDC